MAECSVSMKCTPYPSLSSCCSSKRDILKLPVAQKVTSWLESKQATHLSPDKVGDAVTFGVAASDTSSLQQLWATGRGHAANTAAWCLICVRACILFKRQY